MSLSWNFLLPIIEYSLHFSLFSASPVAQNYPWVLVFCPGIGPSLLGGHMLDLQLTAPFLDPHLSAPVASGSYNHPTISCFPVSFDHLLTIWLANFCSVIQSSLVPAGSKARLIGLCSSSIAFISSCCILLLFAYICFLVCITSSRL